MFTQSSHSSDAKGFHDQFLNRLLPAAMYLAAAATLFTVVRIVGF